METKPIFDVVNIFVHDLVQNKIFAIQRSEEDKVFPGMIALPGGSVEKGEDLITAAKREFLEETGYIVEISPKQTPALLITEETEFVINTNIILGTLGKKTASKIDADISLVSWFTPAEFIKSLEEHNFPINNIEEFKNFVINRGLHF